jgi:hypothetical protein
MRTSTPERCATSDGYAAGLHFPGGSGEADSAGARTPDPVEDRIMGWRVWWSCVVAGEHQDAPECPFITRSMVPVRRVMVRRHRPIANLAGDAAGQGLCW